MTDTRIFHIWDNMKNRCRNNRKDTKYWFGKGITVCPEWQGENGFINFYNWSMANGYTDELTIDRIDSNGNYCPENCRWVTYSVQNNNSSRNTKIECFGETKTISEWATEKGINYRTLYSRITNGWDIERALTTKTR